MEKRYIKFKDIFAEIVRKIWIVIIFAVLCAIILPVFQYKKDQKTVAANLELINQLENPETATDEMTPAQKAAQEKYDAYKEYVDSCTIMQLNGYSVPTYRLEYYFDNEAVENGLPYTFYCYITKGYLAQDIAANDSTYTTSDLTDLINGAVMGVDTVNDSHVLLVEVYGVDQEACTALAEETKSAIDSLQSKWAQGEYSLMGEGYFEASSTAILDRQTKRNEYLSTLKAKIAGSEGTETDEEEEIDISSLKKTAYFQKKLVVVGGLLGIALGCIFICIGLLVSGKLYNDQELQNSFELTFLGRLNSGKASKNRPENMELIAVRIKNYCRNNGIDSLKLCGDKPANEKIQKLSQMLAKDNITATECLDFSQNAEQMSELVNAKAAVLVVEPGKSKFAKVSSDIALLKELDKKVIGYITLG